MGLSAGLKGPASAIPPYPGIVYKDLCTIQDFLTVVDLVSFRRSE